MRNLCTYIALKLKREAEEEEKKENSSVAIKLEHTITKSINEIKRMDFDEAKENGHKKGEKCLCLLEVLNFYRKNFFIKLLRQNF